MNDHRLFCNGSGGRWARHGMVNDFIRRELASSRVPSKPGCNPYLLYYCYGVSDTLAKSFLEGNSKKSC